MTSVTVTDITAVGQVAAEMVILGQLAGLPEAQARAEAKRIRDIHQKAFSRTDDVYVALRDPAEGGAVSQLIGAFSTEDAARSACQEAEYAGDKDSPPLEWGETSAQADGNSYDVILVSLNVPNF